MGKKDIVLKQLVSKNDIFADIFNMKLFGGKQVLKESDLEERDPAELYGKNKTYKQKYRDVVKKSAFGIDFVILGIENQEGIDYSMPARVMLYDALTYDKLITELAEKNIEEKKPAYSKRIWKEQKIAPVITLVIYYGKEKWDGPRDIRGILKLPEDEKYNALLPYVQNYSINLIELNALTDEETDLFISDFRLIAKINTKKVRQLKEALKKETQVIVHEETLEALSIITRDAHFKNAVQYMEEGGIRMCELVELLIDEGKADGIKEGIEEGRRTGLKEGALAKSIEIAKALKGVLSDEVIAEKTGLPLSQVKKL